MLVQKMCVLKCSKLLSQIFLILRRTQRNVVSDIHRSFCKVQVIFIDVCVTNLLHNYIFDIFFPACFGLESGPR